MEPVYDKKFNTGLLKMSESIEEQDFMKAFGHTFSIDVKNIQQNLKKLVPEKVYNILITYLQNDKN